MEEDIRQNSPDDAAASAASMELQLAIGTTFSVADELPELVIKQEPPEISTADEVMNPPNEMFDEPMDEDLRRTVPDPEEYSDVIMKRAVSPPRYIDPNEEHSVISEELMTYYKEKYQLKEFSVELEYCDKIWKTLQLIKNLQDSTMNEENDQEIDSSNNSFEDQSQLSGPTIPYQPTLGNNNKALPDFRFSIKSKKKLYHCVTCGQEFIDSQHLRLHAHEQHGLNVNSKRFNKPKDIAPKTLPLVSSINNHEVIEKIQTEINVPIITTTTITTTSTSEEINQPKELVPAKKIEKASKIIRTNESQMKTINKNREKHRCFLCKRVTPSIRHHLKNYHKVGCITSILDQCEKVDDTVISETNVEDEKETESAPIIKEIAVNNSTIEINLDESLAVAVKKRKRKAPKWTVQKKKYKPSFSSIIREAGFTKPIIKRAKRETGFNKAGPFKCTICLGIYKSRKTFNHHKRIHRIRGETHENFDPSNCRFINSPLCTKKSLKLNEDLTPRYVFVSTENPKTQKTITDYLQLQDELTNESKIKSDISNGESDDKSDSASHTDRRTCECGRTFRNYHTLYMHEEKCKGVKNLVDADSGIGISIKIKKKNDSYEVVSNNMAGEESFKDSKTGKDSDASSNDSGLASLDLNRQQANTSETSKYSTAHSVLRIQVAEDDEEVDIEDEESIHSTNEDSIMFNNNQIIISDEAENKQNNCTELKPEIKNSTLVPSLASLCKQVLSIIKQPVMKKITAHKCQTCMLYFENKKELMDHATSENHSTISTCPCGKKFKNLKVFNIHVRRYHPLLLNCSYCMTNFDKVENYIEHKCDVSEGKLFIEPIIQTECRRCKAVIDIGEPFDKHMRIHYTDSYVYYCFKCELTFDNVYQRKAHFSKEHGFSVCKVCGKSLHIDYLLKHEAYHEGLGHPCHSCKKAFTQKALLKKHVQSTHEPLVNEVVNCVVCSKKVKLKHLKKHMSLHLHAEICRKCNKCYLSDDDKNIKCLADSDHFNDCHTPKRENCNSTFLPDKRHKEHCQEGTCTANTDSSQNITPD